DNNANPKWNTSTSACEACPTANPYWDGTQCTILSTWCGNQIKNIGLTNYSASGDTVTYNTNMTVSKNLDISNCNLVVKGTLTVNSGITLKAKNVSATSSSANGINNAGTMTVTNKIYGNGYAYGVHNQSTGKMTAGTLEGNHTREYTENVTNTVLLNDGTMNIGTIRCTKPAYEYADSFVNNGTLTADHVVGRISVTNTQGWAISEGRFVAGKATIGTVDLGTLFFLSAETIVTGKIRASAVAGAGKAQDIYSLYYAGGSITADRIVIKNDYVNYDGIVNARIVYTNTFRQELLVTDGIHACASRWFGPGTTVVSNSFNYCSGISTTTSIACGRKGTITGTYQKKCIPTCSGSTPIWNGESCEGCPSIRPNWNAEYGICE
ncbi:MAG: hypothetical protein IJC11_03920, partial [Alphaproteobacteria bacterium]|nr:hypothetical protein [Alphaproteobacteria bacterium]